MSTIHPVRSPRGDSRPSSVSATGSARLGAYLAAGVGASLVGTPDAEAAVVAIDLTNVNGQNITGLNAGLSSGGRLSIPNWLGPGTGGSITLSNNAIVGDYRFWGLAGGSGLGFAIGTRFASPFNFGAGTTIGPSTPVSYSSAEPAFKYSNSGGPYTSPNFGAGSYMGFRFASGLDFHYGYLEVTWNASTATFQILSGAYESTVNMAIAAGAPPTPVPAPSALALLALGGGAFRRARARAA
jgi:hypothetical protein